MTTAAMCKTEQGSLSIVALTKGHGAGVGLKVVVAARYWIRRVPPSGRPVAAGLVGSRANLSNERSALYFAE